MNHRSALTLLIVLAILAAIHFEAADGASSSSGTARSPSLNSKRRSELMSRNSRKAKINVKSIPSNVFSDKSSRKRVAARPRSRSRSQSSLSQPVKEIQEVSNSSSIDDDIDLKRDREDFDRRKDSKTAFRQSIEINSSDSGETPSQRSRRSAQNSKRVKSKIAESGNSKGLESTLRFIILHYCYNSRIFFKFFVSILSFITLQ